MKYQLAMWSMLLLCLVKAGGQTRENYHSFLTPEVRSPKLADPQHVRDYVHAGKLRLSLQDAIVLTLENNSSVRVEESRIESAKFALLHAYQPFDPVLQTIGNVQRNSYPGFNQIQGSGTFSGLTHSGLITYTQTLENGTAIQAQLQSIRFSTSSGFYFINPSYNSTLTLEITQPLLRNRWRFENQAPLVIARRNLKQSRLNFEAQVSGTVLQAIGRYWEVVRARGNLEVSQQSLTSAQASYEHDKRALELGALPPLDIYRSQSEVASRRVQVLQAEYALKQAEDQLRFTIGADQDTYAAALDLDLTEQPDPHGNLRSIDAGTALAEALVNRPEVEAAQQALENDDTSIRLARNHMKPDLALSGMYQSYGVGGNQFSLTTGQLTSRGGLGTSFNQLFGFGFSGYGSTLTLNLPIRNRGAQADLGTALVTRHSDQYTSRQVREQITLDVNNAVRQLEEAKLTLAAGTAALDLAEKTLTAEQRKYQLGAESIFFQLDAQTRVAQAQASLLQAQIEYQDAAAALDYATGKLLASYQVQIREIAP